MTFHPVEPQLNHAERRWTDMMQQIVDICNFANVPKTCPKNITIVTQQFTN
jgi:hypothetical protein